MIGEALLNVGIAVVVIGGVGAWLGYAFHVITNAKRGNDSE